MLSKILRIIRTALYLLVLGLLALFLVKWGLQLFSWDIFDRDDASPLQFSSASNEPRLLTISSAIGCYGKKKRSSRVLEATGEDTANCGEDAFFALDTDSFVSFGVADGVGGWNEQGIDPSHFSRALTRNALQVSRNSRHKNSPLRVMEAAFTAMATQTPAENPGSSTACFLILDKESGELHTANLGDSGFLIVRNGSLLFKSKEQQNSFNFPYQLAIYPGSLDYKSGNQPSQSDTRTFQILPGDVIVVASDGLFDNVFGSTIVAKAAVLQKDGGGGAATADAVAKQLLDLAVTLGRREDYDSPFSKNARKHGLEYLGGKADDVTIIVSHVRKGGK